MITNKHKKKTLLFACPPTFYRSPIMVTHVGFSPTSIAEFFFLLMRLMVISVLVYGLTR